MRYHQCSIMLVQLQGYIIADIQVHYNIILMYVYNIYLGISSPPQFPDECPLLYLVCWAGYKGTDEETFWLVVTELGHATDLVADFHKAYPDKPGPFETPPPRS